MAGGSARANRNRAEVRALGEESRAEKYPTDVQFAAEDPYPRTETEAEVTARQSRQGQGTLARLRQLAAQGSSQADIAANLGMDVSKVDTLMRQFQIKTVRK